MTVLLDDAAVRTAFDWRAAVDTLRETYAGDVDGTRFPTRTMARGDQSWLRTLSGVPAGDRLMGSKLIAFAASTGRASYLIALFDQHDASLVAMLDGNAVTGFRTAATSALATDLLAPAGPLHVAVIGSGFEASNHLHALAAVREIARATVFSPRPESRRRFVDGFADTGIDVSAASSAEAAVAESTLVVCAARSRDETPTFLGSWLRPGMTVVSIGSTLPEQREVDPETLRRADVVVADVLDEVVEQTGDAIAARNAGVDVGARARSLSDLVSGRCPGRRAPEQIAVYKSVGSAVQDLAVAQMCVRRAQQQTAAEFETTSIVRAVAK